MPQRYHKKPRCNKQGLKLSARQLDRYENTGATMLSENRSTVNLEGKYHPTTSTIEDTHHESA